MKDYMTDPIYQISKMPDSTDQDGIEEDKREREEEDRLKKIEKQVEEINNYLYATNDLRSPYGSRTLRARIGKEVREIIREEIKDKFLK